MGSTVIEGARWKSGLAFLGSAMFVLLGLWLIARGSGPDTDTRAMIAGWAAVLLFGAVAPLNLYSMVRPPRLMLDSSGLSIERWGRKRRWAWSDIEELYLYEVRSTRSVAFRYRQGREPGDVLTSVGASWGAPGSLAGHWKTSPEELLALAQAYHRSALAGGRSERAE